MAPLRRRRADPEDAQLGFAIGGGEPLFLLPWLWFFSYISPPVAGRDSSGDSKLQLTFQPPCVFMAPLPLSLKASCLMLNWPAQGGWSLRNRKACSRELVDKSQHGPQGLPCLPSAAVQESGKVNLCPTRRLARGALWGLKWYCSQALDRRGCSHRISHVSRVSPSASAFPIALPACRGLTSPALSSGPRRELGPCTCCGSAACGRRLVSASSCGP